MTVELPPVPRTDRVETFHSSGPTREETQRETASPPGTCSLGLQGPRPGYSGPTLKPAHEYPRVLYRLTLQLRHRLRGSEPRPGRVGTFPPPPCQPTEPLYPVSLGVTTRVVVRTTGQVEERLKPPPRSRNGPGTVSAPVPTTTVFKGPPGSRVPTRSRGETGRVLGRSQPRRPSLNVRDPGRRSSRSESSPSSVKTRTPPVPP